MVQNINVKILFKEKLLFILLEPVLLLINTNQTKDNVFRTSYIVLFCSPENLA